MTDTIHRVAGKVLTLEDLELETLRALNSEYLRHHPEEVAAFLNERSPEDTALLLARAPTPTAAAQILERLNPRVAAEVLALLDDVLVRAMLAVTNPVRAAQIIGGLDPVARDAQLTRLDERAAEQIRELLAYPADSAGALMDPRISAFGPDTTVEEALRKMRTFKEKELGSIYRMDHEGRLAGAVPLGEIATAEPETPLRDLIRGEPVSVFVNASREEVVKALDERRVATLPVVDSESKLVGVIRYRTLVAAAEAEATIGIQTMVGVGKEERALSRVGFAVRQRLPWLEINLATAFAAAAVVGLFEGTIAQFTALAVLMPVVAGQSGNSGMQALAVTMRGLALREVRPTHWPRLIWKEAGTGIINGFGCAVVTAIAVYLWSHSAGLSFVIGLAMVISMSLAGMSGAAVPLILKALGQDPAQSSSRVLPTITDIPVRYRWDPDPTSERVYQLSVQSVRDLNGRPLNYETSQNGANVRIKIGDANRIVTGRQTYRIAYTVRGALNSFADHDELFWNVNGGAWPVPMLAVSATVFAPSNAFAAVACYEGPTASSKACRSSFAPDRADFSATGALATGDQLTFVTSLRKGIVSGTLPILERRERGVEQYFDLTPSTEGAALLVMLGGLGLVIWRWWTAGRDERDRQTIVAEYEPPDKLRPAQVGLLVDEHADTKDVTATIVDLAVRGYLTITELPMIGIVKLFGGKDWSLTRTADKADPAALESYERTIYDGLFGREVPDDRTTKLVALIQQFNARVGAAPAYLEALQPKPTDVVKLSDLQEHFYTTLSKAQRDLYTDSVARKWFPADPQRVRQIYAGLGCLAIALAAISVFVLVSILGYVHGGQ